MESTLPNLQTLTEAIDWTFIFFCGVLVILMQLGFAMLESGLNSHKNTANILFKNLADLCVAAISFYITTYLIKTFGKTNIEWLSGVKWFYQMAFAATAATIVSGAVAGRMRFKAYLFFSAFLSGVVYPIIVWICWTEGGFFKDSGFIDLAGSVVVHGVGGAAALAAVIVLRPRHGRYSAGFVGHHNLAYVLLGTIILWVGWYGFNAGSIGIESLFEGNTFKSVKLNRIIVNTTLGAAAGGLSGMLIGVIPYRRKLNLKAAVNGTLGGLVAITANCDIIENYEAIIIGMVAGALVIFGEMLLNMKRWEIDDTIGAVPVHGLCGIWGGLAVSLFGEGKLSNIHIQLGGILCCLTFVFIMMWSFFSVLKALGWLEVDENEESVGLDESEHGLKAYRPMPSDK